MELPKNKPMDRGNASATASATPISVIPSSFSRSRSARRASRAAAASASSASRNDAQDAKFEDARYDPPFVSLNPARRQRRRRRRHIRRACSRRSARGPRAPPGVTTAQAAPPSSAAASSAVCTRLDVRRGLTCTMTSGEERPHRRRAQRDIRDVQDVRAKRRRVAPARAHAAGGVRTTAHPRPAASSVAASAAAAPSDAPPASQAHHAARTAVAPAPRHPPRRCGGAGLAVVDPAAFRRAAGESGATRDSHPSKPRRSRSGFHGAGTGPRGSRNWQFKCTGPGRAPRRTRVAAFAARPNAGGRAVPGGQVRLEARRTRRSSSGRWSGSRPSLSARAACPR